MQDLMIERDKLVKLLTTAVERYRKRGYKFAKARHDYEVTKAKKIMLLRAENFPVTIIRDLALGDEEVAIKRLNKDIALTEYESCQEAIQSYKLKIRIVESQIEREWNKHTRG